MSRLLSVKHELEIVMFRLSATQSFLLVLQKCLRCKLPTKKEVQQSIRSSRVPVPTCWTGSGIEKGDGSDWNNNRRLAILQH